MSIDNIDLILQNFKDDYLNGSTTIAKKALQILLSIWNLYGIRDIETIVAYIYKLKASKPTMAAVQNVLSILQSQISASNVSEFPKICVELLEQMDRATTRTIENFARFLERSIQKDSLGIITASYSSTVVNILLPIISKNIKLHVFALESKWRQTDYSAYVVQKCNEFAIRASWVGMNALFESRIPIDFAIIGADRIVKNRGVVNGIPSLSLAEFSNIKGIPFFVVGESFKMCGDATIEDGFEFIPNHLIQKIFSDEVFERII